MKIRFFPNSPRFFPQFSPFAWNSHFGPYSVSILHLRAFQKSKTIKSLHIVRQSKAERKQRSRKLRAAITRAVCNYASNHYCKNRQQTFIMIDDDYGETSTPRALINIVF